MVVLHALLWAHDKQPSAHHTMLVAERLPRAAPWLYIAAGACLVTLDPHEQRVRHVDHACHPVGPCMTGCSGRVCVWHHGGQGAGSAACA